MAAVSTEKILRDQREVLIAALKEADQQFVHQLTDNQLISSKEQTHIDNLDGVTAVLRARYLFKLINNNILRPYTENTKKKHYENFLQVINECKFTQLRQGILTARHIPILAEALADCTHKWEEIAIALSRSPSDIEECRRGSSNQIRLYNVLTIWQQKTKPAYLKNVKVALESKMVGLSVVADSVHTKLKEQIKSKMQATHQPHRHPVTAAGHVTSVEVADGKCTLLGAELPYSEPASYQWMKDGQNLTDDLDYSGVHTDILLITLVRQGMEGKYSCEIKFDREEQNEEKYIVSVTYSPHKQCLLDKYAQQQEVPSDSWPPVGVSTYIELALIHDEKISKINDYSIRGDMDDILKKKDLTNYEELFGSHIEGGLVLVEGRPGSGKTTLTHKLVRDWAKGPYILRGSKLVFLISLRVVTTTGKDKTLSEILETLYCTQHIKEVTQVVESSYGEGVCFIIDGLDEYSNKDSVITKLLHKKTFSPYLYKAMVIVASRPIGTAELRHAHRASKRIEVLGFSKENISEYIHKYDFNSGSSDELEAYLQTHFNVFHMCYLPVHTAMVCYIHDVNGEISNTETKIYETFTLLTIKRKLEREGIKHAPQSLRELDSILKKCFVDICKLAFAMTTNSTQTISQGETNICLSDGSGCDVRSLGLVTVDSTAKLLGYEDLYAFLHLTFQEYLAACHIATKEEDEQTRIIEQHKDKKEMLKVWKFYCGMTNFTGTKSNQMNLITSSMSMNDIYKIQYAYESQQPSVCASVLPYNSLTIKDYVFTPIDYHAISYVVSNHKSAIHLSLDNCVMNTGTTFDSLTFNNIKAVSFTNMSRTEFTTLFLFLLKLPMMKYLSIDQMLSAAEVSAFTDGSSTFSSVTYLKPQMPFHVPHSNTKIKMLPFNNLKLIQYSYSSEHNQSHYQSLSYLLSFQCEVQPLTEVPEDILTNRNIQFSKVTKFLCLTTLVLINCNMNDLDVHYLLDSGIQYESLRLDVNRITDHGAGLLSDLVRRCTGLKCLSLSCNEIRDEGAMALAAVLHGNTRLMELDLQCNGIGDEGAVAIARAVKDFPSEFQLLLCNVKVTPEGTENVLKYRPTAMIKEYRLELTWKILHKNNADDTAIEQGLKCLTYAVDLNCSHISINFFHKIFLKVLQNYLYIKTLILRYIRISDTCVEKLVAELHQLCSLEVLDLSNNDIGPRGAAAIARWMRCGHQVLPQDILKHLDTTTESFLVSSLNIRHDAEHWSACNLRTLNLSNNMIREEGAAALACGIVICKLESLDLSSNQIIYKDQALALQIQHCTTWVESGIAQALAISLKDCINLKTLKMRDNNFKAHRIVKQLRYCRQLQILDLGSNGIGPSGGAIIAEHVNHWKHLKELNIENSYTDSHAKNIARELQHCSELHTLNIKNCSLSFLELRKVLERLTKCTSLQILKLGSNKFNEATIEALVSLLQSLPNIQQLDLSNCNISDHMVTILTDGLKICKLQKLDISHNEIVQHKIILNKLLLYCTKVEV